jgi:cytochrome oxidase Cu insertion factor (SCO1/SenC/PrrC family)
MKRIISILSLMFIVAGFCDAQSFGQEPVSITVRLSDSGSGDSLYLSFKPDIFDFEVNEPSGFIKQIVGENGEARFVVPAPGPRGRFTVWRYFTIDTVDGDSGRSKVLYPFAPNVFWEAGDELIVKVDRYHGRSKRNFSVAYDFHYSYFGKGAEKNNIRFKVDSVYNYTKYLSERSLAPFDEKYNYLDSHENQIAAGIQALDSYKDKLDNVFYQAIKADLIYRGSQIRFTMMKKYFDEKVKTDTVRKMQFLSQYRVNLVKQFDAHVSPLSFESVRYLYLKASFDDYVTKGTLEPGRVIQTLTKKYDGVLRERLITYALFEKMPANFNALLDSALINMKDPVSLARLKKLEIRRKGLTPFPFNLPDATGNYVKLEDFKGKLVFVDFWYTGCGGCAGYFRTTLSKAEEHFSGNDNIVFVTISADTGKSLWLKGVKTGKYVSDKSINLFTEGKGDKHPAIAHYNFNSFPSLMLIDKKGRIQEFNSEALAKRDPDNLIRVLQTAIEKE